MNLAIEARTSTRNPTRKAKSVALTELHSRLGPQETARSLRVSDQTVHQAIRSGEVNPTYEEMARLVLAEMDRELAAAQHGKEPAPRLFVVHVRPEAASGFRAMCEAIKAGVTELPDADEIGA